MDKITNVQIIQNRSKQILFMSCWRDTFNLVENDSTLILGGMVVVDKNFGACKMKFSGGICVVVVVIIVGIFRVTWTKNDKLSVVVFTFLPSSNWFTERRVVSGNVCSLGWFPISSVYGCWSRSGIVIALWRISIFSMMSITANIPQYISESLHISLSRRIVLILCARIASTYLNAKLLYISCDYVHTLW